MANSPRFRKTSKFIPQQPQKQPLDGEFIAEIVKGLKDAYKQGQIDMRVAANAALMELAQQPIFVENGPYLLSRAAETLNALPLKDFPDGILT